MCGVPEVGRRHPLGLLAARADCVRIPPLQLQPCSPIRLVTGLRAERREGVWRTRGWPAAPARTARRARRLCPHPPAPAATVLAYTPGDRTSPAPQATHQHITTCIHKQRTQTTSQIQGGEVSSQNKSTKMGEWRSFQSTSRFSQAADVGRKVTKIKEMFED